MSKNNLHHSSSSNIWFSFVVGAVLGSSGLYLFGTKKGRQFLKKMLDVLEDLELNAEDVLMEVEGIIGEIDSSPKETSEEPANNLNSVMHKIQHVLPIRKNVKKYFSKEGQIQKSS